MQTQSTWLGGHCQQVPLVLLTRLSLLPGQMPPGLVCRAAQVGSDWLSLGCHAGVSLADRSTHSQRISWGWGSYSWDASVSFSVGRGIPRLCWGCGPAGCPHSSVYRSPVPIHLPVPQDALGGQPLVGSVCYFPGFVRAFCHSPVFGVGLNGLSGMQSSHLGP